MGREEMFSKDCLEAINKSVAFATEHKSEYVTIDHLMLFISETSKGREIFKALGLDTNEFQKETRNYIKENIPTYSSKETPQITITLQRTLEKARMLQQNSEQKVVDEGFVMVALFDLSTDDAFALNYLSHFDVSGYDVMEYLANGVKKEKNKTSSNNKENTGFLEKYAVLLNRKASEGKIDPVIGREEEIDKVINILAQRRKNNPVLVGEPGVGKTAIAEGFAKKIVENEVPEQMKDFLVYSVDLTLVVAGTRYRGDFEERIKGIIKEASEDPNIVLFIDEIHTLIGTGAGTGTMDAGNMLKPSLSSGELKVIGATTYEEYRKIFDKEGALSRRFQKVEILEPSEDVAINIINGLISQYEDFHKVTYTPDAISSAVKLTSKYMNERRLPDKAIDIIDMAGAKLKLISGPKVVTEKQIKQLIAEVARIPVSNVEENEKNKLMSLESELRKEIFGQPDAITQIVDTVIYSRNMGATKSKPIGSFLFAGPSGVGKTELSKQLANKLGVPFLRFDMSEYMEKHTVSRLVGAPPGYVGSDNGGQLTEAVRKNPHCVLLLDELEKAHADIYNILLQIMDYAMLTDSSGQKFSFKNVILIMTSNLGARELSKNSLGFTSVDNVSKDRDDFVKKHFSPEFYNRLDSVIQFNPLAKEDVIKVVDKQLSLVQTQLSEKKIEVIFSNETKEFIATNGFDPKLGARPIERFVEKEISKPISKEIFYNDFENGGKIKVNVVAEKIKIQSLPKINKPKTVTKTVTKTKKPRATKVTQ